MKYKWDCSAGMRRYMTEHGQEVAYISYYPTVPAHGAIILGIKHPHRFRTQDEAMAYIETYMAVKPQTNQGDNS